jgi:hypothetical protein
VGTSVWTFGFLVDATSALFSAVINKWGPSHGWSSGMSTKTPATSKHGASVTITGSPLRKVRNRPTGHRVHGSQGGSGRLIGERQPHSQTPVVNGLIHRTRGFSPGPSLLCGISIHTEGLWVDEAERKAEERWRQRQTQRVSAQCSQQRHSQ